MSLKYVPIIRKMRAIRRAEFPSYPKLQMPKLAKARFARTIREIEKSGFANQDGYIYIFFFQLFIRQIVSYRLKES